MIENFSQNVQTKKKDHKKAKNKAKGGAKVTEIEEPEEDTLPPPPANTDWSRYKQGEKKSAFWFEFIDKSYYEYSVLVDIQKDVSLDQITLGFHGISHDGGDRALSIPSSIIIEGGPDKISLQTIC